MQYENEKIRTDSLFQRLIQPASEKNLEKDVTAIQDRHEPILIRVWNNTHLCEKSLYDFCCAKNIPYQIKGLSFNDYNAAAFYICKRQLLRSDLTNEYRKYLIGQAFYYRSQYFSTDDQSNTKQAIALQICNEFYISAGTVLKYSLYSSAMNTIFEHCENLASAILLGKIKISHENMIELSRLRPEEIRSIEKSVTQEELDHLTLSYIRNEVKWCHVQTRNSPRSRRESKEDKMSKHAAIRQMPVYDPDSEVNSLCMTIESWISSIERVRNSDNFSKITSKASLHLMKKLSFLEHTINSMQESLVERTNL